MASDILEKIVTHKKKEVAEAQKKIPVEQLRDQARARTDQRSFYKALAGTKEQVRIIAEIKRASPSKGDIKACLDPAATAGAYEKGGAAALSVLTDKTFFKGSVNDLKKARSACSLPVLRKDFIISEYQLYEASAAGADAALLIVRILTERKLLDLMALCKKLSMEALVEIHSEADLEICLKADASIIGINNRNLASFDTDIKTAMEMSEKIGADRIAVAASGIFSRKDIESNLKAGISRFLIGESLVRANDPEIFLKQLING
jgi:indole-3-glycerol phosphate synthase